MGVERELWIGDIEANLYKDNPFLTFARNHDPFVLLGKVVYLPQAGAKANAVRNRGSLPATVTTRADSVISYVLDEFSTDPILIPNIENYQLTYDKRQSVVGEYTSALMELACEWMLYNWRPTAASQIVRTSGADAAATANATATGTRKILTAKDVLSLRTKMSKQNIRREGRKLMLSSEMLGQLQDDATLKNRDFAQELDMKNGVIVRLYGFDVMERSSVYVANNAATPVIADPTVAAAATDNEGALAWHPDCVARALGSIDFFDQERAPQYYGDIYSFQLLMGGRKTRANGEGVFAIIQTP